MGTFCCQNALMIKNFLQGSAPLQSMCNAVSVDNVRGQYNCMDERTDCVILKISRWPGLWLGEGILHFPIVDCVTTRTCSSSLSISASRLPVQLFGLPPLSCTLHTHSSCCIEFHQTNYDNENLI